MILLKIVSTTSFGEVRIVLESCLRYTRIPVVVFFFFVQRKRYIHNRSSRSHIRVNVSMQFDGANFPKSDQKAVTPERVTSSSRLRKLENSIIAISWTRIDPVNRAWPAAIQTCIVIDRSMGKFRTGRWPVANTVCSMFDRATNKVSGWKDRYRLKRKKEKKSNILFRGVSLSSFLSLERDKFAPERTVTLNVARVDV